MESLDLLKSGQFLGQKRLDLSCELTELPSEILDLADSLEILNLGNNRLSTLPDWFGQLKKLRIAFFTNNEFEEYPAVLATCPALSMVSFKNNKLAKISEPALSPTIRWLILTNNRIKTLPAAMGNLSKLQKLMLAGNELEYLPNELAACQNLELIRLAANRLQELPDWLLTLPRLAWLAYAGNPYCVATADGAVKRSQRSLPTIDWTELQLGATLGQGASGVIYRGTWMPQDRSSAAVTPAALTSAALTAGLTQSQAVAVKVFKGEVTSDGLPLDEMRACMAAGSHPNLVQVLGKLAHHPENKAGLVFSFIAPEYRNLGGPPDFATCTRDTYSDDVSFTLPVILRIVRGMASALAHLHENGIMHGDLYAHNILVTETGESFLGDFGAAFFYKPNDLSQGQALERLEVRAFGCLLEDLLDRYSPKGEGDRPDTVTLTHLRQLQRACMHSVPGMRPLFRTICEALGRSGG